MTDTERGEYTRGLRLLADLLDEHPELELPYSGSKDSELLVIPDRKDQKAQGAAWARALPGQVAKQPRDYYLDVIGNLAGLWVQVILDRGEVCERVVTGTETKVLFVPDPELAAAVPLVERTETVEKVEWVCSPLLTEATS